MKKMQGLLISAEFCTNDVIVPKIGMSIKDLLRLHCLDMLLNEFPGLEEREGVG